MTKISYRLATKHGVLPDGAHDFASRLQLMKYEAAQLGLWKTMHALEPATQAVGYEMAEILDGKRPDHTMETEHENH